MPKNAPAARLTFRCPRCGHVGTRVQSCVRCLRQSVFCLYRPVLAEERDGPAPMSEIKPDTRPRLRLPWPSVNEALNGGLVVGSTTLISGWPAVGKSTWALQVLSWRTTVSLYVTTEEASSQIRSRHDRVGLVLPDGNAPKAPDVWEQREVDRIVALFPQYRVVVIDSISQVADFRRTPAAITEILCRAAARTACAVILLNHVTKKGHAAGPERIQHLPDAVCSFTLDKDRQPDGRLFWINKHRFGRSGISVPLLMGPRGFEEET